MSDLDTKLLEAHAAADTRALVTLYQAAADAAAGKEAESFYLTHAYVYALEINHARAAELHRRLRDMGCEQA